MASQSKTNSALVASSAKNSSFKSSPSPTPKKQLNTLWVDLSSKLASNSKLISDKCKKYLENNLCLYCGTRDHKLNSCSKKQTIVSPKSCSTSATASKKPSEKWRVILRTPHRLRAMLNFSMQQQVWFDLMHPLFPILIHSLFLLLLSWFLVRIILIKFCSKLSLTQSLLTAL